VHAATSIAILGGGPSGLTLARTLADLGFTRVVVFEREAAVGGKSCTVDFDGRPHDLGATMGVPIDYRDVVEFGREAGLSTVPFPDETHYSLATGRAVELNRWHELPGVLGQAAKYLALHARSWRGELHRADPVLYGEWSEVVRRHRLDAVSRRMLCYRTGYGYGFDDEVPAVMYASLIRPRTLLGLAVGEPFMWRTGTQPIWKGLAASLVRRVEIRTRTPITRIARVRGGVAIASKGRVEQFDRVVIAVDPGVALPLLDANATERRWFSAVRTYPYATVACELDGLAEGRTSIGYLDDNMRRDRMGHPMAWVKRYADSSLHVVHLFAPEALPISELARRIGEDVARLGGRLGEVRAVKRWRFFPHFDGAFMRAGGLAELDRWQGATGAYVIGEVLSFATMGRVAEHAVRFAYRMAREPFAVREPVELAS
jgi:predicted NAD/FAD-dependent oxidoreductase